MNCSWLPYLTQRWCCERDHMRKGQIKNHGYSLTLKLCRYSPQVLLSLPTSISECCCLSEISNCVLLQNMNLKAWLCTHIFIYFFLLVPSLFSYLLTFKHVWGNRLIGLSETHRCTDSQLHIPLPKWKLSPFPRRRRLAVFKIDFALVFNAVVFVILHVFFLTLLSNAFPLWQSRYRSSGLDLTWLLWSFFKLQTCGKCRENFLKNLRVFWPNAVKTSSVCCASKWIVLCIISSVSSGIFD